MLPVSAARNRFSEAAPRHRSPGAPFRFGLGEEPERKPWTQGGLGREVRQFRTPIDAQLAGTADLDWSGSRRNRQELADVDWPWVQKRTFSDEERGVAISGQAG